MAMTRPWIFHMGHHGRRALCKPESWCERVALWRRGWRPFSSICVSRSLGWWTKTPLQLGKENG
jgi:hypothetical protein